MGDTRAFLYPGLGNPLLAVAAETGNAKSIPETATIPDGDWSESTAAHDCKELMLAFVFEEDESEESGSAAEDDQVEIQRSDTSLFTEYDIHETINVDGRKFFSWAAGETLLGHYRAFNNSGRNVEVYVNKRIN